MTTEREQQLLDENALLRDQIAKDSQRIALLEAKIDALIRRLFGAKSEALDAAQLELLLDPDSAKKANAAAPTDPGPAAEPPTDKARTARKPRDLSHLEVRETLLVSDEVLANPHGYRELDRIVTDRLDFQPSRLFIKRLVRLVHIAIDQPDAVPVKAAAPPSLGLAATPRLVAHVIAAKYRHHRPHYRTQGILRERHRVDIARNTLCHWDRVVADTLEPLYKLIHHGLLQSHYLQADETPVRYLDPGGGKCATGYLWVLHAPRDGGKGDILYQWHPSRRAACLDHLLGHYQGFLQTDAYAAYDSWAARKPGIHLVACWAHARRKFHEAFKAGQTLAAGPLASIQQLYHLEAGLRKTRAPSQERARLRSERAVPQLHILKDQLITLRQRPEVLPRSPLGSAIDYTLGLWEKLTAYQQHGCLEIDNNWIENGIRPTAIGKKNWLFAGSETTGQRAAILYTLVECAARCGHPVEAYLADVLERLPAMTNQDDLSALLPAHWKPASATPQEPETACAV